MQSVRDSRAWLTDMMAACDLPFEFTRGKVQRLRRRSPGAVRVERQFEIVGEALRLNVSAGIEGTPEYEDSPPQTASLKTRPG